MRAAARRMRRRMGFLVGLADCEKKLTTAKDIRMGDACERMAARYEVAGAMVAFSMILGVIDGLSDLPSPWSLAAAAVIIGVFVVGIPKIPRK
jgi:hypothetical protein